MTDNCTNVRHTEKLITSVPNVSLQHNKLQYKQNGSIIFLSINLLLHTRSVTEQYYYQTERQHKVHNSAEHFGLKHTTMKDGIHCC